MASKHWSRDKHDWGTSEFVNYCIMIFAMLCLIFGTNHISENGPSLDGVLTLLTGLVLTLFHHSIAWDYIKDLKKRVGRKQ